jgi:hypothetical protein
MANEIVILNAILEQKKAQTGESLSESDFFEVFTFEQILKNYDLSYDELLSGKTGAGDDGGIDGFFAFVDGEFLNEDTDITTVKKNPKIELYLIQSKTKASFEEKAFDTIITTANEIFDLTKDMNVLRKIYNPGIIEKASVFRDIYLRLQLKHPALEIFYFYVSKGDTTLIHPKVEEKSRILREKIMEKFPGSNVKVIFLGARELLEVSRIEKSYTLQLGFLENPISRRGTDYVILSSLKDYYKFVTDENGNLRRYIFESNVRDYQGDVEVNKDIRQTLELSDKLDFWWLNNGITIITSKAQIAGKTITLDDVQVVNGLQTTTMIYNYLKGKGMDSLKEDRAILIRIIVTDTVEARDRIIKATNFQTRIPDASLRATDSLQRNIEDFFLHKGFFYDRRKNYYKNLGKPSDKIVSIPYLAQAIMAIVLREPNNARGRPTSLIKLDQDYKRVFDESLDINVYLACALIMKTIEGYIRSELPTPWQDRSNLRFHFTMLLIVKMLNKKNYTPEDLISNLKNISNKLLENDFLNATFSELMELAHEYEKINGLPIERITKSRDFDRYLLENVAL